MIKNIIFDWSGTISNDFEIVYHTVRAMFHDLDIAPISFARFQEVVDIPYQVYIKKLFADDPTSLAKFSDTDRNQELFEKHFRTHGFPDVLPGVESALEKLQARGIKMAVLSSHHQDFLEEENKLFFNGKSFFDHIFGSAENKLDSVSELLRKTRFNPTTTLMVGDTGHDIIVGKKAGMKTAAVLTGYHIEEELASLQPDFIVKSVFEIPELF